MLIFGNSYASPPITEDKIQGGFIRLRKPPQLKNENKFFNQEEAINGGVENGDLFILGSPNEPGLPENTIMINK